MAGNRPGLGDYRPGPGGNRPDLGDYRPGPGGNRPGLGDYRPGAGGNRPGSGGNRPGRPDYGDNLGIVNRPNPGNNRPGGGWGGGWFGNNNTLIVNNGWGGVRRWPGHGWGRPNSRFLGNWYQGVGDETSSAAGSVRSASDSGPGDGRSASSPPGATRVSSAGDLAHGPIGWLYSGFTNPYFIAPVINTTVVANAPPVFVPDYSRPLDLTSIPPEPEDTRSRTTRRSWPRVTPSRPVSLHAP